MKHILFEFIFIRLSYSDIPVKESEDANIKNFLSQTFSYTIVREVASITLIITYLF